MRAATTQFIDRQIFERVRLHGLTFARDATVVAVAFTLAEVMRFDGPVPAGDAGRLAAFLPFVVFVYGFFTWRFGIHRRLWEYAGMRDAGALTQACVISAFVLALVDLVAPHPRPLPLTVVPMGSALALIGLIAVRKWRDLIHVRLVTDGERERVLIVGAGEAGRHVVADLLRNPGWRKQPIAFLDDDTRKRRMRIHGVPVLGGIERLPEAVVEHKIDIIAVAVPSGPSSVVDRILDLAQGTEARIQILPSQGEVMAGKEPLRLRDFNLDDLLDRDPSTVLDDPMVQQSISGRVVLVTGARGSIGFELCRQILRLNPVRVLALDNNETGLFYLQRELRNEPNGGLLEPILADITEYQKLNQIFKRYRPDIVFHSAAYKHVPMLESYPEEAIYVNVMGSANVCRLAAEHECERFVFVSTDKAVQPANVLGYSKRIGELVVGAYRNSRTVFCSVRFGNVVGSRGSALPEFVRQIDDGGPVTITHPDVERYFMTISEAVSLVIRAGADARGGELFMLDMGKPIKIADIVKRIIRVRGLRVGKDIEVIYTGLRPGEKMTEELVFDAEQVTPTDNPGIFCVEDSVRPDLSQLVESIAYLSDATHRDDPRALSALLSKAASGERLCRSSHLTVSPRAAVAAIAG